MLQFSCQPAGVIPVPCMKDLDLEKEGEGEGRILEIKQWSYTKGMKLESC